MEYVKPQIIIFDNDNLKKIIALANSGLGACAFSGACTGGPADPCSSADAWH